MMAFTWRPCTPVMVAQGVHHAVHDAQGAALQPRAVLLVRLGHEVQQLREEHRHHLQCTGAVCWCHRG